MFRLKAVLLVMMLFAVVNSANAATISVNTVADELNTNGQCSLREAITNINDGATTYADCVPTAAYGTSDTINIPAGTYTNALAGGAEDFNATGDLDIRASVTLQGAGAGTTIIDGADIDRVFQIPAAVTVVISGVTIQNGYSGGAYGFGGGILNGSGGTLTVTGCTITSNNGTFSGGIYNTGTLTVSDSTISNNSANNGGGGGGIANGDGIGGTATITNSTITGNYAGYSGGINNYNASSLTITNSTITSNTGYGGGGIVNYGSTANIINSTIANNTATATTADGIYHISGASTSLSNTIVANAAQGGNCEMEFGAPITVTGAGYNLADDSSCFLNGVNNSIVDANAAAGLGALANNGGSTQTHALLPGSAAIDAGNCNGGSVTTDQRGTMRPQGTACDIGAYEQACTPAPSNMVSWWGGDNNALDMVGTNHGTLVNGATYAPGMVGQAFSFDGVDDFIEIPNAAVLNPANAITVDAWYQPVSFAGNGSNAIVSKGYTSHTSPYYQYHLGVSGDQYGGSTHATFTFAVSPNGQFIALETAGNIWIPGNWYHVAGTYDGVNAKLYVNGVEQVSAPAAGTLTDYGKTVRIGAFNNISSPVDYTPGLIDEVEIFNRALSADEIAAIYNAGSAGKCRSCTPPPSNMISWWDAEGDANDIIGTNNGTLMNGATFAPGKVGQAFSFDGVDDYVEIPDSPSLRITNTLSIDFWAKRQGFDIDIVLEKGGDWSIGETNYGVGLHNINNNMFYFWWNGGWRGTDGVSDLNWHHYAVVAAHSQANPTLYIDGVEKSIQYSGGAGTVNLYPSTRPLHIGAQIEPGANHFGNNLIDEVEIFNRALSASEIATIYNAGSAGKCFIQQYTLTVTKAGTGSGTVTATGISCGADCSEIYNYNTVVAMTATPDTGSTFSGWSGDTDCSDGSVTMTGNMACTATFTLNTYTLSVSKAGTGSGTVTATGIDCGADCSEIYNYNTVVTLTATPNTGSTFSGWSGDTDCSDGSVTMTGNMACTATFTLNTYTLSVSKAGTGSGTVTATGISCGADCSEIYDYNTVVTLTATPNTGSSFSGWSGGTGSASACTGTGNCIFTITADSGVTATFNLTYSISGRVTRSGVGGSAGAPLSGVTMTLSGAASRTTTTDANGNYTFTLPNGSYTVTPSMTGYAFTPMSRSVTINNANVTGRDFTGTYRGTFSISGTIRTAGGGVGGSGGGAPIAGVTVTLSGSAAGTTTTNSLGAYTFTGLSNGNYTVTPSMAGYACTPYNRAVAMSGANVAGQDFTGTVTGPTYTISGTVFRGGSPFPGVTITLSGAASRTTTTDANGNYSFTLPNGSYTVTPSMTGYAFAPTGRTVAVSGANLAGQDFTGTAVVQTYSISGTVRMAAIGMGGGAPLSGVTITISGAASGTTTTNSLGAYTLTGLSNGNYTVTPSQQGYTFTPVSRNVNINNANAIGRDFTRN